MRINHQTGVFLIYFTFILTAVTAVYYVNYTDEPLDYQNPPCKLASPEIQYSANGRTVNLASDVDFNWNERIFVGYTKTFEVFEYIGCIGNWDLPRTVQYSIHANPGMCYSACQTKYFGVHNSDCYCFTDALINVTDTRSSCIWKCFFPRGLACGGGYQVKGVTLKYTSIYKRVAVSVREKGLDDEQHCQLYNQTSESLSWVNCMSNFRGSCRNETDPIGVPSLVTEYVLQWIQYTAVCFLNEVYPSTEITTMTGTHHEWVGNVRAWTTVNVNDARPDDFRYGYYGYIKKINNELIVDFTKERTGYVLCMEENETTTTTSPSTPPTPPTFPNPSPTFTNGKSAEKVTPTIERQDKQGNVDESGNPVPIVVYIVIPCAVLLIVIAIVVLVIRRKRKHATTKNNANGVHSNDIPLKQRKGKLTTVANATYSSSPVFPTSDNIILDSQYANSATNRHSPGNTDESDYYNTSAAIHSDKRAAQGGEMKDTQDDDYSAVESPYENPNVHETPAQNDVDETYDTTNAVLTVSAEDNGNIYNKLNELSEDTYDHGNECNAKFSKGTKPSANVTDDSYSCFSKEDDTDNVYNTADEGNHTGKITTDDTYSHINPYYAK